MATEQVQLGDRIGNLTVSPVMTKTVDIPDESESADGYWEWDANGQIPFVIKMQAAGVLKVVLIGEAVADAKLTPFHEGWNAERVWRIYADADNDVSGLVIAGR